MVRRLTTAVEKRHQKADGANVAPPGWQPSDLFPLEGCAAHEPDHVMPPPELELLRCGSGAARQVLLKPITCVGGYFGERAGLFEQV
jgi:hypothetical protein